MPPITLQLLITLGGNAISIVAMLATGFYVLTRNRRRPLNILFFFLTLSTAVFALDYIISPIIRDPSAAYVAWLFNGLDVLITMSVVHFILEAVGERKKFHAYIVFTYVLGFAIAGGIAFFPHLFLPYVAPRLYFPTYLVGGPLYFLMFIYFLGMPLFPFARLVRASFHAKDLEKRRFEYFIFMMILGYGLGCMDFPLVFNIPVDPVFGMLFGLYLVPIAYGIVSDQLFNISIFLERTILYFTSIAILAGALIAFVFTDNFIAKSVPQAQAWMVPVFAALVAVIAFQWIWRKLREIDDLKYQFITIAAHKLRTPLGHIRWQSAALMEKATDDTVKKGLAQISDSAGELVSLTNLLVNTAQTGEARGALTLKPVEVEAVCKHALERIQFSAQEKKIQAQMAMPHDLRIMADEKRLEFILDVLLDNAVRYTPSGGRITISAEQHGRRVVISVSDNGIGIAPADRRHVFTRFFRSAGAKLADTEGTGLGLSVAKDIIASQHGTMGAFSDGINKGSTFWFALPAVRT